jgi:hypothetical protein
MPAHKNIGHAGNSEMANITKHDDEFPMLEGLGLYAAPTPGDGNCLFHSLSDQVCNPIPALFRIVQSLLCRDTP